MAQTVKDKIDVAELSKYGVRVGTEYVNFGKMLSESEKGRIVPGGIYEVELYVADSGKRYINKVISAVMSGAKPAVAAPTADIPKAAPKAAPKASETMSKAEWNAKDRSQLIGGLSHDAAMLVAAMMPFEAIVSADVVVKAHKKVLEGLLKNREELK